MYHRRYPRPPKWRTPRRPPAQLPQPVFDTGFVTPVRPNQTPWPPQQPYVPLVERPIDATPARLPHGLPTPQMAWSNPYTTPVGPQMPLTQDEILSHTPVWPTPRPLCENYEISTPGPFGGVIRETAAPTTDNPNWRAGTFPPQPHIEPAPIVVHPHILYNPINPAIPTLHWDILHSPYESARFYTGRHVFVKPDWDESAVLPDRIRRIWVESDFPLLRFWMDRWGPLVVDQNKKITIRDLLTAIHSYLMQPLTREDVKILRMSREQKVMLDYSWLRRSEDADELYSYGLDSGYRRIDVLGSYRKFAGLRAVVFANNEWRLYFGLLPLHDGPTLR